MILEKGGSPSLELGAYRVESTLGRGGMGEVVLAWDERLRRHVAIKRIRADKTDERHRARLRREARAVARLRHPAIVQVFDVLEIDGDDCIVMEHVEGRGLDEMLADGPLDVPEALRLARAIADGLAAAHDKGLIHRDLKASNVRVEASGPKILDFGLVRGLDRAELDSSVPETLTTSGHRVGTPHAMSPEQARGRPVDPRSDLFALGTLLYEMLTGVKPFLGEGPADTLRRVVSEEPVPIRERRPEVPEALAELIRRLLDKDPSARPAGARQVVEELRNLLAGPEPRPEALTTIHGSVATEAASPALRVLVMTDLVGSTRLVTRLGDERAADVMARHDRAARDLFSRLGGQEIDKADGFLLVFERPAGRLKRP